MNIKKDYFFMENKNFMSKMIIFVRKKEIYIVITLVASSYQKTKPVSPMHKPTQSHGISHDITLANPHWFSQDNIKPWKFQWLMSWEIPGG